MPTLDEQIEEIVGNALAVELTDMFLYFFGIYPDEMLYDNLIDADDERKKDFIKQWK